MYVYFNKKSESQREYIQIGVGRYNERLKTKTQGSKLLSNTGFFGGRVQVKIETRLRDEMFKSERGEYVI